MARVCAEPGCPKLGEPRYCIGHQWPTHKLYFTKRWKRRRAEQLRAHPYCQCPKHRGQQVKATIADHLEPHRGDLDKFWHGELQSLARECHDSWKQTEEQHGSDWL